MNADTLPIVSAEVREAEERAMDNAGKSTTPAEDIRVAIAICARDLLLRAQIVNMLPANSERSEIEEASAFIAFLGEVCRPMDECLRSVIRTASDNCGGFSPGDQDALASSRMVKDTVHDHWIADFPMKSWHACYTQEVYTKRYARSIEIAERTQR